MASSCGDGDILVLSFGLWYNLLNVSCSPDAYGAEREEIVRQSAVLRRHDAIGDRRDNPLPRDKELHAFATHTDVARVRQTCHAPWPERGK